MENQHVAEIETEKTILRDIHVKMLLDHKTDVDEEMSYIAEDAFLLPPGSPPIKGARAIREAVGQMVKTQVSSMGDRDRGPSRVEISKSRDFAWDQGKFVIVREGPQGPVEEKGYYVTLYKKVDGQWKFLAQIWNNIK